MNELFQGWLLKIALGGGCVCVTMLIAIAARRQLDEVQKMVRRLPVWERTLIVGLLAVCIAYGGSKTNVVDGVGGTNDVGGVVSTNDWVNGDGDFGPLLLMGCNPFGCGFDPVPPLSVTPEDIARCWQLVEVKTNAAVDYTMPEGAALQTNWWVRGAFEDVAKLGIGDPRLGNSGWRFPFGSNNYSSAWAFTWGKLRFELANTNTEIAAVGSPMSAVPYRSRLWSAADTNGARLVTWENFALNRDTNTPVNAQIELAANGDFTTRSNEVESVYRRVDPEDWDGDGWRNGDDPDPYTWDDPWDDFYQELPDGANEDAYCWIEIRPRWHSYINFVGDGPSDLDDPYLWAKAGKTYRVQLLIGKTYFIESTQPLDVVGQSASSIEVDGDGTSEINVVWPVQFSALVGNGSGFRMRVIPACLGGTFVWTDSCCPITGSGVEFWYAHCGSCGCGGCYASGEYRYQGYCLSCTGGWCDCPYNDDDDPYGSEEDDGPYASGASVSFSDSVVIFEDTYTNMPGEVVARQSTRTTLTCVAHGGDTGGTATFTIEGDAKLVSCAGGSLPVTRFVPPCQKIEFEIDYEGKLPSGGERDIIAKADFTERGTGTRHSTQRDWLTSVKVELEADKTAPANPDRHRHVYGIAEDIHYRSYPTSANVTWTFPAAFIGRGVGWVMCPWSLQGLSGSMTAQVGGVDYEFDYTVVEPVIEARNPRVNAESAYVSPVIGEAGHLLLYLDLYAMPLYVSFEGVQMREVPDESQSCPHQGYYDDRSKGGNWSHTSNDGAGEWHTVSSSGYVMSDKAGRRTSYQTPWASGWKEWDIPMEWGEGGVVNVPFNPNPTTQRFELQSDGLFTIRKHGHYAERNIFGLKWCDGELVW